MMLPDLKITVRMEVTCVPTGTYSVLKLSSVEQIESALGGTEDISAELEALTADTLAKALRKLDKSKKILHLEEERKLIAEDAE